MSEVNIKYLLHISDNKEIELTDEEARALYQKLHTLFKKYEWTLNYPHVPTPIGPIYTVSNTDPIVYPYITCSG